MDTEEEYRLGGSALAQCYGQLGDQCPDLGAPEQFAEVFSKIQKLIESTSPVVNVMKLTYDLYFSYDVCC